MRFILIQSAEIGKNPADWYYFRYILTIIINEIFPFFNSEFTKLQKRKKPQIPEIFRK